MSWLGHDPGPANPAAGFARPVADLRGPTSHRPADSTPTAPPTTDRDRTLRHAVRKAADAVAATGLGRAQVAVMLDDQRAPLIGGSDPRELMRPWSLIKPVTAVALLQARRGKLDGIDRYLKAALYRSENCAQRAMVLELTRLAGGADAVKRRLREVVEAAGGRLSTEHAQESADEPSCAAPSAAGWGLPPAEAAKPALLVGTTEWRIGDAVRFVAALRRGTYGTDGYRVLGYLRHAKLASREMASDDTKIVDLKWGSGNVFGRRCWLVAYKGGWGLRPDDRTFLAAQVGVVELPAEHWAAYAIAFHAASRTLTDASPDKARAPAALEAGLEPLRRGLQRVSGACR